MAITAARRRCPGIALVPQQPDLYTRIHHRIVAAVLDVLPIDAPDPRRRPLTPHARPLKIEPLLPSLPRTRRGGRPWLEPRAVSDGLLWVLKTGARWCDLPAEYPSPSTCWRRLKRWNEDGTWRRLWRPFIAALDPRGRLQWETAFTNGTFAPAKKGALPLARRVGTIRKN